MSSSLKRWVVQEGQQLFENGNLGEKKKIAQFPQFPVDYDIEQQIVRRVNSMIDVSNYDITITKKCTSNGYKHPYHIDGYNAREFKKTDHTEFKWVQIPSYHGKTQLAMTALYYMSNHGVDFNGGELEFIDGCKIRPKKNLCVVFDPNTMHKVWEQVGVGNRSNPSTREFYLILMRTKESKESKEF